MIAGIPSKSHRAVTRSERLGPVGDREAIMDLTNKNQSALDYRHY